MSAAAAVTLKHFKSPGTVIGRFVARRTLKSAGLWGLIFGLYMASKTIGFAKAYPTATERAQLAHTFGSNIGLSALLGVPHKIETIGGYAAWNSLVILTIAGSVWAFLLATKYFRGEEDNGRSEMLQSGQTTARGAAINTLAGLGSALLVLFTITALLFLAVGKMNTVGFTVGGSLFFALSCVAGAAMFMGVGAFTSQLMPTRARASSLAAIIFAASFLIRAMADVTSLHWLLNISPLGWIERLEPLTGNHYIWLLPIIAFSILMRVLTVWLAGKRDLGESILADKASAKSHTTLLRNPFTAALRLNRATAIGWLAGITFMGLFYGLLTNAAVQAFNQAGKAQKALNKIEHTQHLTVGKLYLGVVFLILIIVVMSFVASAVGKVREDEAEGYVDNFLVRPVSRWQWLGGRTLLIVILSVFACLLASLGAWAGQASQHVGVPLHNLLTAGLNMLAPVIFTLGVGIFAFGLKPRLTTIAAYGVLGWSFLIAILGDGLKLSHWFLDTSLLHQISLAPAANPNWTTNSVMIGIGLGLCLIGGWAFNRRDLQSE